MPHVVVWSDGLETQGDALQLVDALRASGVRVHVPAQPELPPQGEVVVEQFELPAKVRANVPFPVAIGVQSSGPAKVRCTLSIAGQPPVHVDQVLAAGVTRVEFGLARLKDAGTQAAITRDLQGGLLFSNPAAGYRAEMTLRMSSDDGATWPYSKLLYKGAAGYSQIGVLSDGTVLVLFETGRYDLRESITLARLKLGAT